MRWLRNINKSGDNEYIYVIRGTVLRVDTQKNQGHNFSQYSEAEFL